MTNFNLQVIITFKIKHHKFLLSAAVSRQL
ncbi:protein of unknown function [Xenorhabdus poinarii G6]|uniref:Uncharacterized protein n=1 Tax=Xenorhabdus poinarii G6 TaxID=1354304 RepID=A0A068R4D7_9GAMM|nr:protein of unknown function [Xenorhabdus poinarii G6]